MAIKPKPKPRVRPGPTQKSRRPSRTATPSMRGEGSAGRPKTKPAGSKKPAKPGVPTSLRKPAAKQWKFGRDGFIPDNVMDAGMLAASVLGAGKIGLAGKAVRSVKAISKAKPKTVSNVKVVSSKTPLSKPNRMNVKRHNDAAISKLRTGNQKYTSKVTTQSRGQSRTMDSVDDKAMRLNNSSAMLARRKKTQYENRNALNFQRVLRESNESMIAMKKKPKLKQFSSPEARAKAYASASKTARLNNASTPAKRAEARRDAVGKAIGKGKNTWRNIPYRLSTAPAIYGSSGAEGPKKTTPKKKPISRTRAKK